MASDIAHDIVLLVVSTRWDVTQLGRGYEVALHQNDHTNKRKLKICSQVFRTINVSTIELRADVGCVLFSMLRLQRHIIERRRQTPTSSSFICVRAVSVLRSLRGKKDMASLLNSQVIEIECLLRLNFSSHSDEPQPTHSVIHADRSSKILDDALIAIFWNERRCNDYPYRQDVCRLPQSCSRVLPRSSIDHLLRTML